MEFGNRVRTSMQFLVETTIFFCKSQVNFAGISQSVSCKIKCEAEITQMPKLTLHGWGRDSNESAPHASMIKKRMISGLSFGFTTHIS